MPAETLRTFLDDAGVKYVSIRHSPAYTAQEIAARAHIPGKELAKTVMVKVDGDLAMAVVPASYRVDLDALAEVAGGASVELAREPDFEARFPDAELGAMPPFGNLYDMDVYVSETLAEDDEIAFNAGSHSELIRMDTGDFRRLAEPTVGAFSVKDA